MPLSGWLLLSAVLPLPAAAALSGDTHAMLLALTVLLLLVIVLSLYNRKLLYGNKIADSEQQVLKNLLDQYARGAFEVMTPQGGACFWLAATHPVDMRQVLERLLAERIVIAPGELFSQQGSWKQHLRLSFTLDWSKDIAQAVEQLSQAIRQSP